MKDILIVAVGEAGMKTAELICRELNGATAVKRESLDKSILGNYDKIVYIGAMGICVRDIAPLVHDKHHDPAVVCLDTSGRYAISVLSGHIGGANDLCRRVAAIAGAEPVITTRSDVSGLWALDTIASKFGWQTDCDRESLDKAIFTFVNGRPTALLLDTEDEGTRYLRSTLPQNVRIIGSIDEANDCELIIAVTYRIYHTPVNILYYRPPVLTVGVGCRRDCIPDGVGEYMEAMMIAAGISPVAIKTVSTIELKKDESLIATLCRRWKAEVMVYGADMLADIEVPNPSEKVKEVTGVWGVAESCAIAASEDL